MPSPKSRECWNPAVPPPPVAGAAVGTGLGVAEGLGVGLADGVTVGVIVGLADGLAPTGRAEGRTLALGVGVAEPVAPGEIGGGVAEGEDPEQAEMAAEASMAKATQPTTVSLARRPVPMTVARVLILPQTCNGLFITGILAGHERLSRTVSRQTTQRYRLGKNRGER
jgi:hypothetical protein